MIEKFEIKLGDEILEVISNEDETYTINNSTGKMGVISPVLKDEGLVWTTLDLIAPSQVEQIGELIESHHM